jgi:hypothetical protein
MLKRILACAAIIVIGMAVAHSQPPAATKETTTIKRVPLQKFDVPGTKHETVVVMGRDRAERHDRPPHPSGS